ncbi:hypothetical protein GCM10023185_15630 [Hymenobacter saemangeumensis]|uniref:DUF2793 domain-containing protein n=1 Tax=Hymenobacter saemangeumensis TaxID=1084522 RepID=A0ABP8I9Z4_9BACT
MGQLAEALIALLPEKIRSNGDGAGLTTAQDLREYEANVIAAIEQLEKLSRGSRLFAEELNGSAPIGPYDVQLDDVFLDTALGTVWVYVDGEWVSRGSLRPKDGSKILGGSVVPDVNLGATGDWYFRYNIAAYEKTVAGWQLRFPLGAAAALPAQAGQNGKALFTDGASAYWATVPAGYSDNQAKDAAASLFTAALVSSNLLGSYNGGTRVLTLNVKPASLTTAEIAATALAPGQFPASEQAKLTTAANWTNGVFTGIGAQALSGVEEGMFYTSSGYAFRAIGANAAVCWKLTSFGS